MSEKSELTLGPESFIDDFYDIPQRMPTEWVGRKESISNWAKSVTEANSITSSFVDDWNDMHPHHEDSLGKLDEEKPEKEPVYCNPEHRALARRAILGHMRTQVTEQQEMISRFRHGVKRMEESIKETTPVAENKPAAESKDKDPQSQGVRMKLPKTYGPFLIPCEDGRVIYIEDGKTWDSGRGPFPPFEVSLDEGRGPELLAAGKKGANAKRSGNSKSAPTQVQGQGRNIQGQGKHHQGQDKREYSNSAAKEQKQGHTTSAWDIAPIPDCVSSPKPGSPSPSKAGFFMSGGLGFSSPKGSAQSGTMNQKPSNYKPPTVEDGADTPPRKTAKRYKNGYDDDYGMYCNATWGGIPVRVANYSK